MQTASDLHISAILIVSTGTRVLVMTFSTDT
jgi:hypothetical protein